MSNLVIVESPTKAKTISKFLGKDFTVLSSFGHIRDLPKKKMGVDVDNNFEPTYEVPADKKPKVTALKDAAKKADTVYLATDEDREGEAIAWHIAEVLKINPATAKRITFHEITKHAIESAFEHPRHIDMHVVDAQQTRRILDRLVGYELSPLLWRKVQRGLSAGRVQSVAVRLVVERERERLAFKQDEYWSLEAHFTKDNLPIITKLFAIGDKKVDKLDIKNQIDAEKIRDAVKNAEFTVAETQQKEVSRKPPTPLTTSSLQQEAYNRLGFSAKQTMGAAQKLYETGFITYMRTDSMNLAQQFIDGVQSYITSTFGKEYAKGGTHYKTSKKGAQEAHEAIRPTNASATPESLRGQIEGGDLRLYDLIWRRTLASQLPSARMLRTTVDTVGNGHTFRATGSTVVFPGFMKVWQAADDKILPVLEKGENIGKPTEVKTEQHFTEPPARYSDATLIKILEEYGIGRPSTYAPTLSTIIDRGYVLRDDNKKLFPSDIAMIVTDMLKEHFPQIVDYEFTANMEAKLDEIAEGTHDWRLVMSSFYGPFHALIAEKLTDLTRADVMKVRVLGKDPNSEADIIVRTGRFGPYVQVGEATDENPKPRRASLTKEQLMDTLTLEDALKLLILPRVVGVHDTGEEIMANVGRFGPYLKCGEIFISLPPGVDPATIQIEEAKMICTEGVEKKRKALEPIAELGKSPEGINIVIRDGRYGMYVTDGKTNATIKKGSDYKDLTLDDALAMLKKKRESPKRNWPRRKKAE